MLDCEVWLCQGKLCPRHSEVLFPRNNVKESVPPTPVDTSRCIASLHTPKVYFTCRKAHLVENSTSYEVLFSGPGCGIRTHGLLDPNATGNFS